MEKQTCPRRVGEIGPWEYGENLDHWRPLHEWTTDEAAAQKLVDEYVAKNPNSDRFLPFWDSPDPIPRECSFCGGLHPDDVIVLLKTGRWTLERTDKGYKAYLRTKAGLDRQRRLVDHMAAGVDPMVAAMDKVPAAFDPQFKVYLMHFSREQINEVNRVLGLGA